MGIILAALFLAIVHAMGARLRFIRYVPRSAWLSFAGGIAVAYVFVHLLPELSEHARSLEESTRWEPLAQHLAWLIALAGMVVFYFVEVVTRHPQSGDGAPFWFSIGTYTVYNALIAYLLHKRAAEGASALATFTLAMGLHFLVNDFALREKHQESYSRAGRWIIIGGIIGGASLGAATTISEILLAVVVAFVAGGVILNVLKEELPREAQSRLGPFAAGMVAYSLILIAL